MNAKFLKYLLGALAVSALTLVALACTTQADAVVVVPTRPAPLTVVSVSPVSGTVDAPLDVTISVTFSEALPQGAASLVVLVKSDGVVPTTATVQGATITLTPKMPLAYVTAYACKVSKGVQALSGSVLADDYAWSFVTKQPPDVTPPTIISVSPKNGDTGVMLKAPIVITFSKLIDPASITPNTVKLSSVSTRIEGGFAVNGATLTFTPDVLAYATTYYCAVVKGGVKDLAGNALAADYPWSFATLPLPFAPPTLDPQYHAVALAADEQGNVYAYGYFGSPVTDIFVARFDSNGMLKWLKVIATPVVDWPQGGIVATRGYVYIQRIRDPLGSGTTDIYVDKLEADTGLTVWSTQTDFGTMASSIAVNEVGNVYATTTRGTTKLNSNGAVLSYSNIGGSASAYAWNGLFVAGTQYVATTNHADRYLTRTDANLNSLWTEWRTDVGTQDVRGVIAAADSSYVYVAEDTYTTTTNGVQFWPLVTGYKYNTLGGAGTVSRVWAKPLSGGRINASANAAGGACYIAQKQPSTLSKLLPDGTVAWKTALDFEPLGVTESGGLVFVADDTNAVKVYHAANGTKY